MNYTTTKNHTIVKIIFIIRNIGMAAILLHAHFGGGGGGVCNMVHMYPNVNPIVYQDLLVFSIKRRRTRSSKNSHIS